MSASKSQRNSESKLKDLQCHFTWALDPEKSRLLRLKDKLEDIGTEKGNLWLGHIYNLQGFIEHKLGLNEEAKSLFQKATEALNKLRKADEGPWLVVNYGNLAWLHHHLGDQAESQAYLSKVDALMEKYPSPSQDDLHPEICAEKAWTLMKFGKKVQPQAADLFEKAIRMQPDRVEWNASYVLGLARASKHSESGVDANSLKKMERAKNQNPKNLYLAAVYLMQLAKKGQKVEDEAQKLASQILKNPVSSYSGIKPLLRLYTNYISVDEAIDLAEDALKKHPDERYLKRCVALCYKWKIVFFFRESRPRPGMTERAISLHREVISLYPNSSFVKKIDLASVYAKSDKAKAEAIFQKLLRRDLEPAEKQVLYNRFAKHLFSDKQDYQKSMQFHMRAASITVESFFRDDSIEALRRTKDTTKWNRRSKEIEEFLAKLKL
ncbi:interferon-induced protein with tetratricopeptide repeats 1-like [Labrus mixtus]|uniref:interferon-induced protein with tetratricopeptide repeats 1-like n=1 Tax=Labrus mixtus TaxID=508554 RepID=UPI0029C0D1E8|nr:interferon-induced protein with tetratricopeptide repeats 1-like [Labrus mixtus]